MKVVVTGSAGFIGSSFAISLLDRGDTVIGIDNHNDYYDPLLKESRLARFIDRKNYKHFRMDLLDLQSLEECFKENKPEAVVHLAAQAGVRYSINNPAEYINSNIVGFHNILEVCRRNNIKHLIYASSSSVYGANEIIPFSECQNTNHPLSLYAATKKTNELMAHSYSHLYGIPTTGLRFFTVYGPWGRPDMALFEFTKAIYEGGTIRVFNHGKHFRDFTYIDDIVKGMMLCLDKAPVGNLNWDPKKPDPGSSKDPWRIFNIGNNSPVGLIKFIEIIENSIGKKANIEFLPIQAGEVHSTNANIDLIQNILGYEPSTILADGVPKFIDWYRQYYNLVT